MAICPYDGFECEIQTKRIDSWRRMIRFAAEQKSNRIFITSKTMFDDCEDKDTCLRYINLMRQPPQKTK